MSRGVGRGVGKGVSGALQGCSEITQAGRCETAVADTGPQGPPQLAAEPLRTSFPARMRPGHAACEQRMGKDEGCRCEPWGFTDMKKVL